MTPPGGRVSISAHPGLIAVEDTGPGLAADEVTRAFDRFFLWSRYGDSRRVGTGLGLAIVKQLTEQMGGRVAVESEPGGRPGSKCGCRFYSGLTRSPRAVDEPRRRSAGHRPRRVGT